jgi:predicted RNase H-like nuclease (RuvC/YqgF family)
MYLDLKKRTVGAVLVLGLACQGGSTTDVQQEAKDLREAQSRSPEVAKSLEADLAQAKAEVARLEQKLALARQGVTDDVLDERKELEQSLQQQQRHVQNEINEAKREAEQHNQDTQKATEVLEGSKPPARVEAEVTTQTRVTPAPATAAPAETERQEVIQVRGREMTTGGAGAQQRPAAQP